MNALRSLALLALAAGAACAPHDAPEIADTSLPDPAARRIQAVPFTDVELQDRFWLPRFETNRTVTIPHIMQQNVATGRVANFERAAGLREGAYEGRRFNDTDIYKVIEAASYAISQRPDAALEAQIDELIELIAAAQQEDGYLFPARTVDPDDPAPGVGRERWIHVAAGSHELYNAGHLIEAAVAHYLATGKRSLLEVAIRFADLIDAEFGPDAGHTIPGHEEIELALVKLADATGEERYLALARFFIDERGREHDGEPYAEDTDFAIYNDPVYKQDHAPVIEQDAASGHAVRATYLYTGMADVAARTDAPGYREALQSIWTDVVSTKLYLTGGIGARGTFESFGEDYELPNRTAYSETCAAIGNDLWNHRMFLATGETRYLDVMERVLYNAVLAGVSLAGDSFFYTNPLESSGTVQRSEYFDVACCPANLARLMALLPGFIYGQTDDAVTVNLYIASAARIQLAAATVRIRQETDYPWDGTIRLTVEPEVAAEFGLRLRLPGWAGNRPVPSRLYRFLGSREDDIGLRLNDDDLPVDGEIVSFASGFLTIRRTWQPGDVVELELPMEPRRVAAHDAVTANNGKVALQRGPIVYAIEAVDNDGAVLDLSLPNGSILRSEYRDDLLGGVVVITAAARRGEAQHTLVAIPYFAWANRGPGEMAVWIPALEAG